MSQSIPLAPIPSSTALQQRRRDWSGIVGLVPTMGALHEGHLALIRAAALSASEVVVSIFVNPTQFAPHEDFTQYPRSLEQDLALAYEAGATQIFVPTTEDLYPSGFGTYVVPTGPIVELWEGRSRPLFFRGVCTVVCKLFQLVQPNFAIFGEKDFQQLQVIRQMVRDLQIPVEIRSLPTVREADGLAMSSRNRYLTPQQRQIAPRLYQALRQAAGQLQNNIDLNLESLAEELRAELNELPEVRVDYLAFVDPVTLQPVLRHSGIVCLMLAAFVGNTRLIDNLLIQTT